MTQRLYYHDAFLYDFEAEVCEVAAASGGERRVGVVLDRTAFYPTSGGQVYDTGWLATAGEQRLRVVEVSEREDRRVVHYLDASGPLEAGARVKGVVDAGRRRDHMQQHSGQHVLSAAFVRLFQMPTASFHMGEEYCSIDLATDALGAEQVVAAERLANEVIAENREVAVRFVTRSEAESLGLRKIPAAERDELRLVEITDFDLCACGGTHVANTGQIGSVLLRKTERVRQGWRVEFVCGMRAVASARADFSALSEAAGLFSSKLGDTPQLARKMQDEARALRKENEDLLEQLAEAEARRLLAAAGEAAGSKRVVQAYSDRGLGFVKMVAQRVVRLDANVVALLAASTPTPALVFAQSAGMSGDMGALVKSALAAVGGRGGGAKDFAQGGLPAGADTLAALAHALERLSG